MGGLFSGPDIPDAPPPAPVVAPPPPPAPNPEPVAADSVLNDGSDANLRSQRRRKIAAKGLALLSSDGSSSDKLGG